MHGITASHRSWPLVVDRLAGVRLVAPDLRGRGRSRATGLAGMAAHAADLARVLDHLEVDRAVVAGHSMGAFVAIAFADRHPDLVERLVLIDGGLPLDVPEGLDTDEIIAHILGPAAERLAMRFDSPAEYLDYWRAHPAFAGAWSPTLEDYFTYDLVGEAPQLRPATSYEVMAEDTVDLNSGDTLKHALERLRHPAVLLTAPRGLLDQVPGLYPPSWLDTVLPAVPGLRCREVPDVNHYTIVLSPEGADVVAHAIAAQLGRPVEVSA